jgi:hypothetical protein
MIRANSMVAILSAHDLGFLQSQQHAHDMRNHFDILALHKNDRLKHYGLHFAKYVGRLSRQDRGEPKPVDRTIVDTFLVSLSAANTLHQELRKTNISPDTVPPDRLRGFADAAGRFADACEKIDHMEDFLSIARTANLDILSWVLAMAKDHEVDLIEAVGARREELAERQFYICE